MVKCMWEVHKKDNTDLQSLRPYSKKRLGHYLRRLAKVATSIRFKLKYKDLATCLSLFCITPWADFLITCHFPVPGTWEKRALSGVGAASAHSCKVRSHAFHHLYTWPFQRTKHPEAKALPSLQETEAWFWFLPILREAKSLHSHRAQESNTDSIYDSYISHSYALCLYCFLNPDSLWKWIPLKGFTKWRIWKHESISLVS